jgi:CubicO group peptidase (beta-lactamase class C family)
MLHAEEPLHTWPTTGWKTSSPEEHGINSSMLDELYANERFTGNLLLVRHGFLVSERYDQEQGKAFAPHIFSCTKGIISALIGIAFHHGHLTSIQQPVLDFFPEYEFANRDERKQQMTLYHLLTMTSGLRWNEGFSQYMLIYRQPDWSKYILDQPMAATPGTRFNYNSANAHLLSAILQKTTGMTTLAYAERHLFEPLGISVVEWEQTPRGVYLGGWGVKMTLEDMAKFGYLYLREGMWKGQQVVPAEWIKESIQKHMDESGDFAGWGYGYLWTVVPDMPHSISTLLGGDGQHTYLITVIPDLDIVLVYAGVMHHNEMFQLMRTYLLPAVTP